MCHSYVDFIQQFNWNVYEYQTKWRQKVITKYLIDIETKTNESNLVILKTVMSKIIPVCKEGVDCTEKPSKSAVIRQKWNDFVESSTLHGMHYIFSSQTTFRRIIWTLFLLFGVGYFSYQSSELLKKYFKFPVTTKTTLEYEKEPAFPAVTICNFNMLRKSIVEKNNFQEVTDQALRSKAGIKVNDTIDWSPYKDINVLEIYRKGGHQIRDMILECSWKGERCSYQNFTPILTSMGLCHTFNSGKIRITPHTFSNAFQDSRTVFFLFVCF